MEELNNMNLDELLNTASSSEGNTMSGSLFADADVEVTITKESTEENTEMTNQDFGELNRKKAMEKLEEYEAAELKISKLDGEMSLLNQEFDNLISKIKLDNKELIDKINNKANEIEAIKAEQEKIKEELVPLQREVYLVNNEDKTLKYNKIQSTYVAPTEKNQFDLKTFREEQGDFWKENLEVLYTELMENTEIFEEKEKYYENEFNNITN